MTSQIKLLTSDYEEFSVDRDVIERSVVIKHMLEGAYRLHAQICTFTSMSSDGCLTFPDIGQTDHPIPLLNVSATVLAKVRSNGNILTCTFPLMSWGRFSNIASTIVESRCP